MTYRFEPYFDAKYAYFTVLKAVFGICNHVNKGKCTPNALSTGRLLTCNTKHYEALLCLSPAAYSGLNLRKAKKEVSYYMSTLKQWLLP